MANICRASVAACQYFVIRGRFLPGMGKLLWNRSILSLLFITLTKVQLQFQLSITDQEDPQLQLPITVTVLGKTQLQLSIKITDLQKSQLQLSITNYLLRESQLQLPITITVFGETQLKLSITTIDLHKSQLQLSITNYLLRKSQLQLPITITVLGETQLQLSITIIDLQKSQLQLPITNMWLRKTQLQLSITIERLGETQLQFHYKLLIAAVTDWITITNCKRTALESCISIGNFKILCSSRLRKLKKHNILFVNEGYSPLPWPMTVRSVIVVAWLPMSLVVDHRIIKSENFLLARWGWGSGFMLI